MQWIPRLGTIVLLLAFALPVHAGVTLDGVDGRISFGDLSAYDAADTTFTVVIHFKTTSSALGYLLARRVAGGTGNGGWFARLEADGTMTVRIVDGGNLNAGQRSTVATVNDGTIQNLAAVVTTNTTTLASNDVTLYVKGVQSQGARTDSGGSGYHICSASCTLMAGATSDLTSFFAGTIEMIEIYPVGLTTNEITTLGVGQLQRPGLSRSRTVLWPLDDCAHGGSINSVTFRDRSGNGRDGTGSNGANGTGDTCTATTSLSIPWGAN